MDWLLDGVSTVYSWVSSYRLPYINLTMIEIAIICIMVSIVLYFILGSDDDD